MQESGLPGSATIGPLAECIRYYHTSGYEINNACTVHILNMIALAPAIYTPSLAAYKALQSVGILKLPSKATLQAYTGMYLLYMLHAHYHICSNVGATLI